MHHPLNIGVLGIGAVGTVISSLLYDGIQGHRLIYFNRTSRPYLKISTPDKRHCIPIDIITEPNKGAELDWLIICLKEHQYTHAQPWFDVLIGPNTKVAIIRNGINHELPITAYAPLRNILPCIIDCPIEKLADNKYKYDIKPRISIPQSALGDTFKTLFPINFIDIILDDDFKSAAWKKLCFSASLGAIQSRYERTCEIFKESEYLNIFKQLIKEAILVGKADGANIESNYIENMTEKLLQYPLSKGSSMLSDKLNNRIIEVGAKNGVISRLSKVYKIATPLNDEMNAYFVKYNSDLKS